MFRDTRSSTFAFVASLLGVVGCSANVSSSAEAADAESSTAAAVVVVERTSGDSPRGEAVARFVRGRSGPLDEQAILWLGLEPELPALGTCARTATDVPSMPASGLRLLDVGKVTLTADATNAAPIELVRRRVPDVVDTVSGVVYTASALDLPSHGTFDVKVVGEPELSGVRATTEFAGEPANIRVQAQDVSGGAVLIATDAPVDISWDTNAGASTGDLIYVDVSLSDSGTRKAAVTRCTVSDSGRALVPASAFGDADGLLSVHRMRRSNFRAPGIDRGELRLDFAREVVFAVRTRH